MKVSGEAELLCFVNTSEQRDLHIMAVEVTFTFLALAVVRSRNGTPRGCVVPQNVGSLKLDTRW